MDTAVLFQAASLAAIDTVVITSILFTVAALVAAGIRCHRWLEDRRFATDLKWMVASLRCGADYVCLIVSARYRHRGDLMNVIEQQIEVVGMQMATDIFRSTEYRPR